ncbi:hypothetical protein RQ087_10925 [Streptococcus pneumoniae]|nr:hypothetical protein [Streptococcus pneumoniae]MDS8602000.1 hypothetical protein [Streptococcus pneumoniae]MDT5649417.1 hypothetical protein [Streptococcus pneumoniae]MDT5915815.1 hypothetical protein [Streptococcus pneumoniae]
MKTFKELVDIEGMVFPNSYGVKRVQRFNPEESVNFLLDKASRELLKRKLPFDKINEPTLKKFAENIIILNRQKHRVSDRTRMVLMNEVNYSYSGESFYTTIVEYY